MARGLKVGDWVEEKELGRKGFITENLGNGFWKIFFLNPEQNYSDTSRSNKLDKLEFDLDEKQEEHLLEIYKNLAIDTKDWKWLTQLAKYRLN